MTQARDAKKKTVEAPERRKPEERQADEMGRNYSLLHLQRHAGNRAVVSLLESHGRLQTKSRIIEPGDEYEQEADQAAAQVLLSPAPSLFVQRKCATCGGGAPCAACEEEETIQRKAKGSSTLSPSTSHVQLKGATPLTSAGRQVQRASNGNTSGETTTESTPETASEAGPLIVEDDATSVAPGQMRKSEFLKQLRGTVCATADEALAEAGQSTQGCPYIEQWFSHYADKPPAHIERALRRYAPEAATATSARDYIPAVSNRVRQGIATWARTGDLSGVPEELQSMMSGPGAMLGAIGGALGSIGSAIGGAITAAAGAVGGALSSIGKALFKQKEGHSAATDDPQAIQSQLRGGQPLDGETTSRMGAAFGADFSKVRVHTNANAAGLSEKLNARAFTVGSDIAFGAGEYQPGSLVGDALIAHELAHVVQQHGGVSRAERAQTGQSPSLETEADEAAVNAVMSSRVGDASTRRRSRLSELKTGLRLQRCGAGPYSATDLEGFVKKLETKGVQRGFFDDDRARAAVQLWQDKTAGLELSSRAKYLLIQTLLDGSTGGDDERAILDLLVFSSNPDLLGIFGTEGLRPDELDKKFSGDNLKELLGFYSERFVGGRDALASGRVIPKGEPKRSGPMTHEEMVLERAKKLIPIYEKFIEEWNVYAQRQITRKEILASRAKIEDEAAAAERRPEQEAERIANLNRKPLKIEVTAETVTFRVKFQAKFLDPKQRGNFSTLKSAVESAAAERWSKDAGKVMEGKKRFELIPEVTEIKHDAPRDQNYWLIEVRPTDDGPVEHPGCKLDQPGVPAGVTDSTCDGGVMSLPPKSIGNSDLIAHEMHHLFGLVDRYLMVTRMKPGDKEVDKVETIPMRTLDKKHQDPLGAEKGPVLDEDLAFLFEHLGVYETDLYRGLEVLPRLHKQGMGLEEVERDLERQKEIVRLGHDPRSLIPTIIRRDFTPAMVKNAEDL